MHFHDLATVLERLEATSSRNVMYDEIGDLFERASAEEAAELAYMLEARLLPPFKGVETGMGERTVAAAIAAAAKLATGDVAAASAETGDLGLAAERLLPARKRRALGVADVHAALLGIARTSGRGSAETKVRLLSDLLRAATPLESRYIVRLTLGRLRLGVGAPTIIGAVARRQEDPKRAGRVLERAYNLRSDLGLVMETLATRGLDALARFKVRVGSPVRMMKAERLPGADEIVAKLGRCAVEAKLDGLRCQAHLKGRSVQLFSRNLERLTDMFPEVTAGILSHVDARSAILDGEAIAVDPETGEFHPFQVTVQRKRKHGIDEMAGEVPLAYVAFDVLYADGRDYTPSAYEARRAVLERIVAPGGAVRLVERAVTDEAEELRAFFHAGLERGYEGVIAKRLSAPYEAGARSHDWIKLKRTYRSELSDTIDLAVVGYLRGRGARARLGIGALLGAVYDEKRDMFATVAKIGSGLGDADWVRIREQLDARRSERRPARVDSRLEPDVWVEPGLVVTVLADEITRSPVHTAGIDDRGRGLALRFPRVVGFVRADKSAEDATTVAEVEEMYGLQRGAR